MFVCHLELLKLTGNTLLLTGKCAFQMVFHLSYFQRNAFIDSNDNFISFGTGNNSNVTPFICVPFGQKKNTLIFQYSHKIIRLIRLDSFVLWIIVWNRRKNCTYYTMPNGTQNACAQIKWNRIIWSWISFEFHILQMLRVLLWNKMKCTRNRLNIETV